MSQEQYTENLKVIVAERLKGVPNFNEDITYVAEYIVLLIVNGGTVESVVQELSSLFDSVSPEALQDVVQTTFFALEALQQGESLENIVDKIRMMNAQSAGGNIPDQQQQQQPSQGAMLVSQHATSQTEQSSQPISAFQDVINASTQNGNGDVSQPQSAFQAVNTQPKFQSRGGGVGKSRRGARGASRGGLRNTYNSRENANTNNRFNPLARALGMVDGKDQNVNFVRTKKEGRCKVFPHCPLGRSCPHAHPTKVCSEYPNCPKAPGTCEFLHPNEDEELMKEIEKTREEFQQRKLALLAAKKKPVQTGIVLCKFGTLCSNPMCPFGHPTPANEDAKVIDLMWCPNNLTCEDPQCTKAHSSLSKIREVKPMTVKKVSAPPAMARPPVEKSLEQCKYGIHCTNKRCKFRHAKSHVMCRDGANCTRIDCFFGHPINEDCRFGVECKNAACLFRHPEGRVLPDKKQQPQGGDQQQNQAQFAFPAQGIQTTNRVFALPDSSNIEAAPQQDMDMN